MKQVGGDGDDKKEEKRRRGCSDAAATMLQRRKRRSDAELVLILRINKNNIISRIIIGNHKCSSVCF